MSESPRRPVPPSHSELLEHASFLKRLAARLVGPDGAEDVVQEAFATAMAKPPSRGSLRAWLAVVVANRARHERRSVSRRAAREERAARPERDDDAARALEQLDLQQALSRFVVELPEEQRTVLYLRYFEDLTPSAIAARLGLPLKTIESRHTRALASLRTELDRRAGGDRAAWVSALAVWAAPAGGSALVGAKVAALVLAVVLAGWYFRPREERESLSVAPEVASAPATLESVLEAAVETPGTDSARENLTPLPPLPTPSRARLNGHVRLRGDGSPLVGARVRVSAGELGAPEATTDEHGSFAFEWNFAATLSQIEVLAGDTTTATKQWISETLAPGMTRAVELRVSRGATLSGRVVDEHGEPVPGAEVLGWCAERIDVFHPAPDRRVQAANDGSFVVEHLGEQFVLIAEAPGLTCQTGLRGELAEESHAEGLELVLAPGLVFRGEVVDEEGRPIAQARLAADEQGTSSNLDQTEVIGVRRFHPTRVEAHSGADGRFELGPSPDGWLSASVQREGYLTRAVELVEGQESRIVLERGFEVHGRVFDAAGQPLAGARVRLGDCAGGRTSTDADGRWTIGQQVAADSAFLVVHADGHALVVREPLRLEARMGPIEVRLEPELVVAGRLLDSERRPLVGAQLLLEGTREVSIERTRYTERTTWEWAAKLHRSTTDAEGRFRFGALNSGEYSLSVTPREGPAPGLPFHVQAGDAALELVLDTEHLGVVCRGRVRDAFTGRALEEFTVTVWTPGSIVGKQQVFAGPAGEYELTGLAPGRHSLAIHAPGYAQRVLPERDYASGSVSEDALLTPAAAVPFELANPEPLYADLEFAELDGTPVSVSMGGGGFFTRLQLQFGRQSIAVLPRALLHITARAPRCPDLHFELDLRVPPSEPVRVNLILDPLERRHQTQLGVFLAADPEVRVLKTLAELGAALEAGQLTWPRQPVELEFLEADGTLYGRGRLEWRAGTTFVWSATTPDEDGEPVTVGEEEQGPGMELELPERVRTIRLSGSEFEPHELDFAALRAAEAPVVLLTPRE